MVTDCESIANAEAETSEAIKLMNKIVRFMFAAFLIIECAACDRRGVASPAGLNAVILFFETSALVAVEHQVQAAALPDVAGLHGEIERRGIRRLVVHGASIEKIIAVAVA